MTSWRAAASIAAFLSSGCLASGPPVPAGAPTLPVESPSSPASAGSAPPAAPLLVDRSDLRLGTTVHFGRIPTVVELNDLTLLPGIAHVVLTLPAWPHDIGALEVLNAIPEGSDLVVVLNGYPPTRAAAEAWTYVRARLRIIVVVPGPPESYAPVDDLNAMPALERVIAQMDEPSRRGFERLQRPLSFRKLVR